MRNVTPIQLLLIALIGAAMVAFGWDNENGIPLLQLLLIVGGMYIGGALTLALEKGDDQ